MSPERFESLMNRMGFGFVLTLAVVLISAVFIGLAWLAIVFLGWYCLLALPAVAFAYLVGTFLLGADCDVDKFKSEVKKDFPFLYRNDVMK